MTPIILWRPIDAREILIPDNFITAPWPSCKQRSNTVALIG